MSKRRNSRRRERHREEKIALMVARDKTLPLDEWPDRYRLLVHRFAEILESDGVRCDTATQEAVDAVGIVLRKLRIWPAVYAESVAENRSVSK